MKQHLAASVSGLKDANVLLTLKITAGFFCDHHPDHFSILMSPLSHLKNGDNTS